SVPHQLQQLLSRLRAQRYVQAQELAAAVEVQMAVGLGVAADGALERPAFEQHGSPQLAQLGFVEESAALAGPVAETQLAGCSRDVGDRYRADPLAGVPQ